MKRVFLAGGAVGIAIVVALPVAGGLNFKRETDYFESERFPAPLTTVHIQSSQTGTGWGHPNFLGFSVFGPPYDLLISGTLPDGDPTSALEVTNLTVESDGAAVLSRPHLVIPIETVVVHQGDARRATRGFVFMSPGVALGTPSRIRVSGMVKPVTSRAVDASFFAHVFEVRRTRVLALGKWSWSL
jgi:hypothetical protein